MKIYQGIDEFKKVDNAIVTSGTFDGVHVGHQQILRRLKEIAIESKGETVLITYWPHPRLVLNPKDDSLKLLSTFEEKANLLKISGVDHLISIPFTKAFSNLTSEVFIQQILVEKIGTYKLIIGYDHRFGKNREGSFDHLKENASTYGFKVEEIPRQDIDNIAVSSTKIRKALESGDVLIANHFLGRPYSISGVVIQGEKYGRTIGFPTANLQVPHTFKLIPADGTYAVRVKYNEDLYQGMINIGYRPTRNGKFKTIEVNIFDFDQEIYGEELSIYFMEHIRQEVKFADEVALRDQLIKDKEIAKAILIV